MRGDDARFAAAGALDDDPATYWATDDGVLTASLTLELPAAQTIDRVFLSEHIALGQRIRAFDVEVRDGDDWRRVAEGTTVGARRILIFPDVSTRAVRVNVRDARGCPTLAEVAIHLAPPDLFEVPIPEAPTHYMGREIAQMMGFSGGPWLLREDRAQNENTPLLLERLAIAAGQTVCDLGAGNGFHTLRMARGVGAGGAVYAVELQPEFLTELEARAAEVGITNIRPLLGTPGGLPGFPGPPATSSSWWTSTTSSPTPRRCCARSARRSKPSGRLAVVDVPARGSDQEAPTR